MVAILERKGVRQFVKFAIVGVISTAIDWGVHALLYKGFDGALSNSVNDFFVANFPNLTKSPDFDGAFTTFKVVSFLIAMFNGFFWNRRWTFKVKTKEGRGAQLGKFAIVNTIGLGLNTIVASQIHVPHGGKWNYMLALGTATFVTMFWNFAGHKFWTFKPHDSA